MGKKRLWVGFVCFFVCLFSEANVMGKISFYFSVICDRKAYKDSVGIKLSIQIYSALKKRYEGETFTNVFLFSLFFSLPVQSLTPGTFYSEPHSLL